MSEIKDGGTKIQYRVWWIPQLPMKAFEVSVPDIQTGKLICETLAQYDIFQFENRIKPDYCNAGGVGWRHDGMPEGEWYDIDERDNDEIEFAMEEIREIEARTHTREGVSGE